MSPGPDPDPDPDRDGPAAGEREPDLPLDLREQIRAVEESSGSTGYDWAGFADALDEVDDRPRECPHCGGSLSPQAAYTDGAGSPVALRLVCMAVGRHDGRVANYIYEVATGELYLESESTPKRPEGLGAVEEELGDGRDGPDDDAGEGYSPSGGEKR